MIDLLSLAVAVAVVVDHIIGKHRKEMMQVLGRSTKASQTEDWTDVVDCATQMEKLMYTVRNKGKGAACALRLTCSRPLIGGVQVRMLAIVTVMAVALMASSWCRR